MGTSFTKTLVLLLACVAGTVALAEDPCGNDARQFCPYVKAGSGRLVSCLKENQPRLSAACKQRLDADEPSPESGPIRG